MLACRAHGEGGAIITVFSQQQGVVSGLVRGGRKKRAELQAGNFGNIVWKRRLETQLGTIQWELLRNYSVPILEDIKRLQALQYAVEVLRLLLPEGESYFKLYEQTLDFLDSFLDDGFEKRLVFWELGLLMAVGYGLSLTEKDAVPCEQKTALAYVSPNTGRAVSLVVGADYKDKLLTLPHLFGGLKHEEEDDLMAAFSLTGFFIDRALQGKSVPTRKALLEAIF